MNARTTSLLCVFFLLLVPVPTQALPKEKPITPSEFLRAVEEIVLPSVPVGVPASGAPSVTVEMRVAKSGGSPTVTLVSPPSDASASVQEAASKWRFAAPEQKRDVVMAIVFEFRSDVTMPIVADLKTRLGIAVPAAASSTDAVELSGTLLSSRRLRFVFAQYPDEAREGHMQGTAVVRVETDVNGIVTDARIVSGQRVFHRSVLESATQSTFRPLVVNGQRVRYVGSLTMNFRVG